MSRRAKIYFTIVMFGLCFATLGRAPRMPERFGDETLAMAQREAVRAGAKG